MAVQWVTHVTLKTHTFNTQQEEVTMHNTRQSNIYMCTFKIHHKLEETENVSALKKIIERKIFSPRCDLTETNLRSLDVEKFFDKLIINKVSDGFSLISINLK